MPQDKKNVIYTAYDGHIGMLHAEFAARGRSEAAQMRPPTGRATLDENETELVSEAERCNAGELRIFDGKLVEPAKRLTDIQIRLTQIRSLPDHRTVLTSLDTEVQEALDRAKPTQVDLMEQRMRREVDLQHFRGVHGISSPANYPESHLQHISLVLVCMLCESLANTFFYQNESGLLGGFVVATTVSALNMGTAMALGLGFRFKNLSERVYKIAGRACICLFAILTIYCNALFAAFRSEYQLVRDTGDVGQMSVAFTRAASEAARVFVLHLTLSDFMSFLLFGLGILLSIFAFYKGYTFDDKFPGYGDKDRRFRKHLEAEREHVESARLTVSEAIARQRERAQMLGREPQELSIQIARLKGDVGLAKSGLEHQFKAIRRDFEHVLKAYRDANIAIRQSPPPVHWGQLPDLPTRLDTSAADRLLEQVVPIEQEVDRALKDVVAYAHNLQTALADHSQGVMQTRLPAFIEDCRHAAHEQLNLTTPGAHLGVPA